MVNFIPTLSIAFGLIATVTATALPAANTLQIRGEVSCRDDLPANTLAYQNEAAECIRYLASLGDQACVASVSATSFCRRGWTQITGIAKTGHDGTSSRCQDVARAAGLIMDRCSRGDGTVRGAVEAWGNGDMLVDIRLNPQ